MKSKLTRSDTEVTHKCNRSEIEARSGRDWSDVEVASEKIKNKEESALNRREVEVTSKGVRSEAEVRSMWKRSGIEAVSKCFRSEIEVESN